jgi:uncharacterized protein DUF481
MGRMCSVIVRVLVAVSGAIAPMATRGQEVGWSGSAEASASLLFGNARDRLIAGRLQFGRADSTLDVRTDSRISYAEATDEDGGRRVSGRTLFASLAADYRPFERWSPFWFGAFESSLQQRIDQRYSSGAGAKYTIYRDDDTEASVSLAALAEYTVPRLEPAAPDTGSAWHARWSLRVRGKHQITKTARFSHVTFYQPRVDRVSRYTIRSTTTVAADLTSRTSLTLTFSDLYDSEARGRGARTNNDGQLLFGVSAGF